MADCVAAIRGDKTTEEELQMAYKLGWLQEILQGYSFAIDDMVDKDMMRWGRPTWYAKRTNDTQYILESLLLGEICYDLLARYFGDKPFFGKLCQHFHESFAGFVLGLVSHSGFKYL